ncbi:MAG: hypothetical protein IPK82_00210 [Polyangiaceae bacterium]|nr:hypothetical protein [Polyangiaceae bacterium]
MSVGTLCTHLKGRPRSWESMGRSTKRPDGQRFLYAFGEMPDCISQRLLPSRQHSALSDLSQGVIAVWPSRSCAALPAMSVDLACLRDARESVDRPVETGSIRLARRFSVGLASRNLICVHTQPAFVRLPRVHNWESATPFKTRRASFQIRKHSNGSQVPNSAMLLAIPSAAQSVLRPLCLLLGLAADCHVSQTDQ